MDESRTYAVFFYPPALEALGDAIKPYLQEGKTGAHVLCREIDTGGSLIEMTLDDRTRDGEPVQTRLMVPTSMVRMIVSAHSDDAFGFGPRAPVPAEALPAVNPGEAPQPSDPQATEGSQKP